MLTLTCTSTVSSTDERASSDTDIVCYNGGVCKQVESRFMCACILGYSGDMCQQGKVFYYKLALDNIIINSCSDSYRYATLFW